MRYSELNDFNWSLYDQIGICHEKVSRTYYKTRIHIYKKNVELYLSKADLNA
jgi:hypothetical protein